MSEKELLHGCQQNDPACQAALYHAYKGRLMGVCRRYARNTAEAEDLLQESFVRIFRSLNDLRESAALGSWMRRIVTRTAINHYHAQPPETTEYPDNQPPNDDYWDMMGRLSTEHILSLIQTLPDGYRVVFNLYVIDGFGHAEIAAMLHISENTSRSQLFKARDMLRKKLQELGITRYEKHT